PFIYLALHGAAPAAVEIVVDGSRCMAVRTIDDLRRPDRDGGEERRCAAVRSSGHGIVHHIQAAADVVLSQRLQLVEVSLHLRPGPMQYVRFDRGRIYQNFIGHQLRTVLEPHHAVGALAPRVVGPVIRLRVVRLRRDLRILLDDMDIEHLQDRRVGVGQPDLKIFAVVAVPVGTERRRVPDVVFAVSHLPAPDIDAARAPDTEVHLRRVVADRSRPFSGLKHAQHDPDAGGETIARSGCTRVNAHPLAAPGRQDGKRWPPFRLRRNACRVGDDDRLPKIERRRSHRAADVAKNGLGHAAVSCFEAVEMRGVANPGCGSARPTPAASARRTMSIASETSEIPIPIGLNSDRSAPAGRGRPAATIAEIGCTLVQSPPHLPSYQSINSALSSRAAGKLPTATSVARGNRSSANSRRSLVMAPAAFTCAPRATMDEVMTGSRARVIKVMIAAPSAALAASSATLISVPGKVPRSFSTKAIRFAGVGLNRRMRRNRRTAATAAACVSACLPLPRMAKSSASRSLIHCVAIADIAPVRICPSARASMIAKSLALVASHKMRSGVEPPSGVFPHVLVPNTLAPSKTAPIACILLLLPQCAAVFSILRADPAASASRPRVRASIAPPRSISSTTSASVIQRGAPAIMQPL